MSNKNVSYYDDFLISGHSFGNSEVLLKFQFKILNMILLVMTVFTLIFVTLNFLNINPLGIIHTTVNCLLIIISIILIIRLRASKKRYLQTTYMMYGSAFVTFISALMFVPSDEFRIIWFYLLIIAAYITGGVRAGNIISILSIMTILILNSLYELHISEAAIFSSILGLMIMSLFIRAYTQKITDFENEMIEQENFMITQSRFAAMGEMMSMIAHQWRQPLSTTTLMITNERMKSIIANREPNEYDKILDKISETMIYLSDTIDDFQTYFKPEKSTQKIEISTLIERVQQFIEPRLTLSKVELNIKKYTSEKIEIYASEVIQVLMNIINNSIDVLVEKNIDKPNIWITIDSDENNITIRIEDNGGGIDGDIIGMIFEPYFSTKSKNGTGLGLYMSKMIIDKHINGMISVSNTYRGACFTLVLPKSKILN